MVVVFRKEDTGLDNFESCTNCPMALALKQLGYEHVSVGGYSWTGFKDGVCYEGIIFDELTSFLMDELSIRVQKEDITYEIPDPDIIERKVPTIEISAYN